MFILLGRKINQTHICWQFDGLSFEKFIAKEAGTQANYGYLNNDKIAKEANLYYPMGICLTLEFDEEIEISFYGTQPEYSIFVTDPSHSTHFNLDFNSHKGSIIKMEKNALRDSVTFKLKSKTSAILKKTTCVTLLKITPT